MGKLLYFASLISVFFISCRPEINGPAIKDSTIIIKYYLIAFPSRGSKDTIHVEYKRDSLHRYIFHYKRFMDYNDTLAVSDNDLIFRGEKALLMGCKKYTVDGKQYYLKKYYWKHNRHVGLNLFVSDSQELVLTRSFIDIVAKYNIKKFNKLHEAVIKDSLFFKAAY